MKISINNEVRIEVVNFDSHSISINVETNIPKKIFKKHKDFWIEYDKISSNKKPFGMSRQAYSNAMQRRYDTNFLRSITKNSINKLMQKYSFKYTHDWYYKITH